MKTMKETIIELDRHLNRKCACFNTPAELCYVGHCGKINQTYDYQQIKEAKKVIRDFRAYAQIRQNQIRVNQAARTTHGDFMRLISQATKHLDSRDRARLSQAFTLAQIQALRLNTKGETPAKLLLGRIIVRLLGGTTE